MTDGKHGCKHFDDNRDVPCPDCATDRLSPLPAWSLPQWQEHSQLLIAERNKAEAERDKLRAFVDKIKSGEFDSMGDIAWAAKNV